MSRPFGTTGRGMRAPHGGPWDPSSLPETTNQRRIAAMNLAATGFTRPAPKLISAITGGPLTPLPQAPTGFPSRGAGVPEVFQETKMPKGKKLKALGGAFKAMAKIPMGLFGAIIQLLDKLGIFQPIIDALNGLLAIFSGKMLEGLMPAFQKIIDILLSDEVMSLIGNLADLFIVLMEPLMDLVITVLPPLIAIFNAIFPIIMMLVELALVPLKIIFGVIGAILEPLTPMFELLGDALEPLSGVISGITGAVGGIVGGIGNVFGAIGAGLADMFGINDKINQITQAERDASAAAGLAGRDPLGGGGAAFAAGVHDSYALGISYVPQSGPYMLEQGEKVISASGNTGSGRRMQYALEENTGILQQLLESSRRREIADRLNRMRR